MPWSDYVTLWTMCVIPVYGLFKCMTGNLRSTPNTVVEHHNPPRSLWSRWFSHDTFLLPAIRLVSELTRTTPVTPLVYSSPAMSADRKKCTLLLIPLWKFFSALNHRARAEPATSWLQDDHLSPWSTADPSSCFYEKTTRKPTCNDAAPLL